MGQVLSPNQYIAYLKRILREEPVDVTVDHKSKDITIFFDNERVVNVIIGEQRKLFTNSVIVKEYPILSSGAMSKVRVKVILKNRARGDGKIMV